MSTWHDRRLAPGSLSVVQEFVNTLDVEDRAERIGTPESARQWLVEHDLLEPDTPVTESDQERLMAVREALRQLLMGNNGAVPSAAAIALINSETTIVGLRPLFGERAAAWCPTATGVSGAIGELLGIVLHAMANGTWGRLKACRRDQCRWIFYDASKNRGGRWCTMTICGNRAKAKTFRELLRDT